MHKIIAKSINGQEYLYSEKYCYSVSAKKAKIICDTLNSLQWQLRSNEIWHIYDLDELDYKYTNAVFQQLIAGKKGIRIKYHWSVYPGSN